MYGDSQIELNHVLENFRKGGVELLNIGMDNFDKWVTQPNILVDGTSYKLIKYISLSWFIESWKYDKDVYLVDVNKHPSLVISINGVNEFANSLTIDFVKEEIGKKLSEISVKEVTKKEEKVEPVDIKWYVKLYTNIKNKFSLKKEI